MANLGLGTSGIGKRADTRQGGETKTGASGDVMAALEKVLQTYKTGGEFSTQRASQLKTQERKYTAGAQQGMVSRGLAGTTVAASIPAAFETEVAAPYRTETERLRSGQEMQGLLAKAGFLRADEDRALREKLAAADITSREKIASMGRGSTKTASKMSTFASREAKRKAEMAEADAGRGATTGGPSQHVGGMGSLDLGIDYGGDQGGQGGSFGGISMADLTPAERSNLTPGYYHDAEGYATGPIKGYEEMQAANPELQQAQSRGLADLLQKLVGG